MISRSTWRVVFLLAVWCGMPADLLASEKLVLNTAFTYPLSTNAQTGFVDVIVNKALNRIGYSMKSVRLPAERALINANRGIDDGDLLRVEGLDKVYTNLIRVPEKIIDLEMVVFSKHVTFPIEGWHSLEPYSVAIITGWKILERNISESAGRIMVKNARQLFNMLLKDRVDIIVYSRWVGLGYLAQNNIKGISVILPPLERIGFYLYLHKKHQDLVPKLANALRAMKADGSYQSVFEKIMIPVAGK